MITSEQAALKYGEIVDGKWPNESKWMTIYKVPPVIAQHLINSFTNKPTTKIYCNKDLVGPLDKAFKNIIDRNLANQLITFDGCHNIRATRGSTKQSLHSWAVALDFCAKENPLSQTPKMSKELVQCFKDAGFIWGGDFKRPDGMHFELTSI